MTTVAANLEQQLVSVEGTAAPSAIVASIQSTGRDAILRGSGAADSERTPSSMLVDDTLTVKQLRRSRLHPRDTFRERAGRG